MTDLNENKISSQKDNNEQKENQNSNQDTNQQKIVKLPAADNVIKNKSSSQKDSNQQKANGKPDQLNQIHVPGMNTTHINGILMEPVNTNYTKNIYFTVKITHKYYIKRLFPIMLTWLQVVDKNKVSLNYITIGGLYVCVKLYQSMKMLCSYGYWNKVMLYIHKLNYRSVIYTAILLRAHIQ